MKKLSVKLIFGLATVFALSQCAPVSMNKVTTQVENGELLEAKTLVDSAVTIEKMKTKGKTWFNRGKVYQAIAEDSTQSYPQVESPVKTAVESYEKAKELEKESSMYYQQSDQRIQQLWSVNLNKGAKLYQKNNYEDALKYFSRAQHAKPGDTTAYLYAGIAAQQAEKMNLAEENYTRLVEDLDYVDKQIFNSLVYIERKINNNPEEALKYIQMAIKHFPDNKDYLKQEINILIQQGEMERANEKLAEAIESEPNNAVLYYNRAYLFEQMNRGEDAIENYKKAIEIDPNYFDAVFNLGAFYYNKAADILSQTNDMDLEEYKKKGKEIEAKAAKWFNKALPHLKKSADLQPDNIKVLQTLRTVHAKLGNEEEAKKLDQQLQQMSEG